MITRGRQIRHFHSPYTHRLCCGSLLHKPRELQLIQKPEDRRETSELLIFLVLFRNGVCADAVYWDHSAVKGKRQKN